MKSNYRVFAPLALAITLVIGVYLGIFLSANTDSKQINFIVPPTKTSAGKLNQILNFIEKQYVDTVEKEKLVEKAISSLLSELDPHSYYISPEEYTAFAEPLEGNFDGIGVEFLLQNDTIVVVNTVAGGPSESAGVMAGDRILSVNGKKMAGVGVENEQVMAALRGKSGSKVNVQVLRRNNRKAMDFVITRGKIPLNSLDVALKLNDTTAYIKLSRFSKTSYQEFMSSMEALQKQPGTIRKVVLDLRGNGGGLLSTAIEITEEFLPKGKLIVYTQGKSQPVKKYFSKREGSLKNVTVDVLINESSASASEILAGAIQDNDRGTIIGRRSFGKGLVQEVMDLPDRSALSLTVARYFTPTGRSIQKPYGAGIDYAADLSGRAQQGELMHQDSMKVVDSLKFKTPKGKIVYGGGGIVPDIFVPIDSTDFSMLVSSLVYTGILNQFAFDYADQNRATLKKYSSVDEFIKKFQVDDKMFARLFEQGPDKAVAARRAASPVEARAIKLRVKALIARNIWGNQGYFKVMVPQDNTVAKAIK